MNKQLILIPGLFVLGIATGVAMMYPRGPEITQQPENESQSSPALQTVISEHPMANAFAVKDTSGWDSQV